MDQHFNKRKAGRGIVLSDVKMLLFEDIDAMMGTSERGCVCDAAIIFGKEHGPNFENFWTMPLSRRLNQGYGHYLISCKNNLTEIDE